MNAMIETSQKLTDLIFKQANVAQRVYRLEQELKRIEIEASPDKWAGNNEAERKLAKEKYFAKHAPYCLVAGDLEVTLIEQRNMVAAIEAAKTELDLFKWLIRNEVNVVCGGRDVFQMLQDEAQEEAIATSTDSEQRYVYDTAMPGLSEMAEDQPGTSEGLPSVDGDDDLPF